MLWLVECGRPGCRVFFFFGRFGRFASAVGDAVLWKDAPPIEFSRLKPVNMDCSWVQVRIVCSLDRSYDHIQMKFTFFLLSCYPIFYPIYYPRGTLALPPSSNSDPGSHSGPSFPLPTTVRAFIFIAKIIQRFLSSSTRVEFCVPI